jgi:hypothetical protein
MSASRQKREPALSASGGAQAGILGGVSHYIHEGGDDLAEVLLETFAGKLPDDATEAQETERREMLWRLQRALFEFGEGVVAAASTERDEIERMRERERDSL